MIVSAEEHKKFLMHHGVKGQTWGVRHDDDGSIISEVAAKESAFDKKAYNDAVSDALKNNPDAHELDPGAVKRQAEADAAHKKKMRNIAIGVGVGVTIAVGTALYLTHKEQVDSAIGNALAKHKVNAAAAKQNQAMCNHWRNCAPKRLLKVDPSTFSAERFSVKAGTTFERLENNDIPTVKGDAYAALTGNEANRYHVLLNSARAANVGRNNFIPEYTKTMKANVDLLSPSKKERYDVFKELWDNDETFKESIAQNSIFKQLDADQMYGKFAMSMGAQQGPAVTGNRMYKDKLKSMGFNALIDDNDAGMISENPLIIFDAETQCTCTNVTRVTAQTFKKAYDSIQAIPSQPKSAGKITKSSGASRVLHSTAKAMIRGDVKGVVRVGPLTTAEKVQQVAESHTVGAVKTAAVDTSLFLGVNSLATKYNNGVVDKRIAQYTSEGASKTKLKNTEALRTTSVVTQIRKAIEKKKNK